ncbi:MAG: LamG domain-containing protein [Chloroflexota bacterium]|nr:LamG domain-containing protein [Chloroflexota bacterium]
MTKRSIVLVSLLLTIAILGASVARMGRASSGTTLFYLDGTSKNYKDTTPASTDVLVGTAQFSNRGRAFGARIVAPLPKSFPYGAYGMDETDKDSDFVYETGDVDPLKLMDAMKADGGYNVALSSKLGSIRNKDKICRTLNGAEARGMRLIVRALNWNSDFSPNLAVTRDRLNNIKSALTNTCPEAASALYAWYGYDEPLNKGVSLSEMQQVYKLHKEIFPNAPVLTVFNQNQNKGDSNGDGISDGMLGQPLNRYGSGIADIVGLNVYPAISTASSPDYGYYAIGNLYRHARKVVGSTKPVWAVAQAHALAGDPANRPEPHHLYRQVNDWLRAGPDAKLPQINGFLWYSWHFPPDSTQNNSDLEGDLPNRAMASAIGRQIRANGSLVTHKLPYRSELHLPATLPSTSYAMRAPRAGHFNLTSGTLSFSLTHFWKGNDGVRHVLFDTGASATKNRLFIEKTAQNTLRLVVLDAYGRAKWTALNVDQRNMPGETFPGYSEIIATWNNGTLALYLDGKKANLNGATSGATGKLSAGGQYLFLGSDLAGKVGANGTLSYVTIRSGVFTAAEAAAYGRTMLLK